MSASPSHSSRPRPAPTPIASDTPSPTGFEPLRAGNASSKIHHSSSAPESIHQFKRQAGAPVSYPDLSTLKHTRQTKGRRTVSDTLPNRITKTTQGRRRSDRKSLGDTTPGSLENPINIDEEPTAYNAAGAADAREKVDSQNKPTSLRGSIPVNESDESQDERNPTPDASNSMANTKTPQHVHELLRIKLFADLSPKDKKGYVYIFRDRAQPELLKIGRSRHPPQRMKHLEHKCGLILERVDDTGEVENCKRVEKLAHADLAHLCRPYKCPRCFTTHGEWFQVDKALAVETLKRWTKFMQQTPYNAAKELDSMWERLLTKRGILQRTSTGFDEDSRNAIWNRALLPPSLLDRLEHSYSIFEAHPMRPFLWEYMWQTSSIVAWMIVFFAFRNLHSCFALLLSVFGSWARLCAQSAAVASYKEMRKNANKPAKNSQT